MSSENPDAASVGRPRLPEEAPAASTPDAARRSSSIARRVAWGFWWRRLARWVVVDLLALLAVLAALWVGYARYLPERALTYYGLVPAGDTALALAWGFGPDPSGLGALALRVVPASGGEWFFPVGRDLLVLWPVGALLLAFEALSLLGIFSDIRRVRRRLKPLNALALRAEALGSKDIMDARKIESLEQAIERASVDSPQVSTGVDDLASIEVALNGLLRQMQEAKLQQIRFVSDASHELRTPIAVIQGYVNMLDRWGKDDRAVLEESIAALKAEGTHMQELVEQLLFLARGDSGRNVLERVPVNLAALAVEVADESAMIDSDHDYRLGFNREAVGDARYVVIGDASMLKQSIRVMVHNAARYSPEGAAITLGVASDDRGVSYSVRDEGIGMTPEEAGHVFERFWRADAARDVSKEGTGLGLPIARWIVERHGGTIDLVAREGVGSRFTVWIPRS